MMLMWDSAVCDAHRICDPPERLLGLLHARPCTIQQPSQCNVCMHLVHLADCMQQRVAEGCPYQALCLSTLSHLCTPYKSRIEHKHSGVSGRHSLMWMEVHAQPPMCGLHLPCSGCRCSVGWATRHVICGRRAEKVTCPANVNLTYKPCTMAVHCSAPHPEALLIPLHPSSQYGIQVDHQPVHAGILDDTHLVRCQVRASTGYETVQRLVVSRSQTKSSALALQQQD